MSEIMDQVKNLEEYIIQFRRELHENPELSGEEWKTRDRIKRELDALKVTYREVGTTSIVASIKGKSNGKVVALRGDFDALPITEEADVSFVSKVPGLMHACGHDAHAAMLLGAVKLLSEKKDTFDGEVRFFFQEGEETFSGAKKMIADGVMEGVDAVFGMHGMPLEVGKINIQSGYRMAGCDTITIKFEGVSGHGSMPHLAKDTIHPASVFVTSLQAIVTKNIDPQEPIVLSVGKFAGGTKANIIAKFTQLDISMRYFSPEAREIAHKAIVRHANTIAEAFEIKADVEIEESAISLFNDEELTQVVKESASKIFDENSFIEVPRNMGSEDMPYYFEHAKGVYAFIGYRNEEKGSIYYPHHEKFNIDEDYLKYGTALHVQFALDFLGQK